MSFAYCITVRGSIEKIVHVEDGVCSSLELLPILAKDRMRVHLESELARRGFAREPEGDVVRRDAGEGVVVDVALESGTVTVRVDAEAPVHVQGERMTFRGIRSTPEQREEARRGMKEILDARLEIDAAWQVEAGRRKATARLEAKLADLKEELDGVVNRVTAEALKEKARQMGEIEEIVEDAETGSLTIKVKL
jgi:hypothetical protein